MGRLAHPRVVVVAWLLTISVLPASPAPKKLPLDRAREVRALEELGAYGQAAEELRGLRREVPSDADLELALALNEARTGYLDSAAARLRGPLLSTALFDSLPVARRREYPWSREGSWINGRFDGWHWYVARARAEVAGALGQWSDALDAAHQCVAARPVTGKEWLILAVTAGRVGRMEEATRAVRRAVWFDPTLPEAHYLLGLHEWRAGRRAEARKSFRAAVRLDSGFVAPAVALVRSQLPAAAPDTLPGWFLTGVRRVALLTSSERPKMEEYVQMNSPPVLIHEVRPQIPDSLRGTFERLHMVASILIDERGSVVLNDLPWFEPSRLPEPLIAVMVESLSGWRFRPAVRLGEPHRTWTGVDLDLEP